MELRVSAVERKRTPDSGRELSDFATFLVTGYSSLHLVGRGKFGADLGHRIHFSPQIDSAFASGYLQSIAITSLFTRPSYLIRWSFLSRGRKYLGEAGLPPQYTKPVPALRNEDYEESLPGPPCVPDEKGSKIEKEVPEWADTGSNLSINQIARVTPHGNIYSSSFAPNKGVKRDGSHRSTFRPAGYSTFLN